MSSVHTDYITRLLYWKELLIQIREAVQVIEVCYDTKYQILGNKVTLLSQTLGEKKTPVQ